MYGIFTYIYLRNHQNVGKYSLHGACGYYTNQFFQHLYLQDARNAEPFTEERFAACRKAKRTAMVAFVTAGLWRAWIWMSNLNGIFNGTLVWFNGI